MVDMPVGSTIGIKELAELNKLSETYLSRKSLQNYEKRELSVPSRGQRAGMSLPNEHRIFHFGISSKR